MSELRKCIVCGKDISDKRSNAKVCSCRCQNYIRFGKGTCEYCGKEFTKNGQNVKYCCRECSGKARTKLNAEKYEHKSKSDGENVYFEIECSQCNKKFWVRSTHYRRQLKRGAKLFCSRACMGESYKDRVEIQCSECGKTFQRAKSGYDPNNKHYFCSKECQAKNQDYILRGKDHYRYIDGSSPNHRGKGWKRTRRNARKRDNHTCQMCGKTEKEIGKRLDVHHIIPYREFESSEQANKLENLICLCPSCHHKEEVEMALRKD